MSVIGLLHFLPVHLYRCWNPAASIIYFSSILTSILTNNYHEYSICWSDIQQTMSRLVTDMTLYSLCISELVQILMQFFRLLLPSCNEKLLSQGWYLHAGASRWNNRSSLDPPKSVCVSRHGCVDARWTDVINIWIFGKQTILFAP